MNDLSSSSLSGASTTFEERLDSAIQAERQAALRALLQCPLLSARGAAIERFSLVRRHVDWLRDWLAENCGWRLHLDGDLVRLQKTPPDVADGTRAAVDSKTAAYFNRRKYVLLCLALATIERGDRQTTLGKLAQDIISLLAADSAIAQAGIAFTLASRDQRGDLVQVVRFLLEWRVLERVDGDEQLFLLNTGDVLYNVNRPILAMMLNVQRGPATINAELPFAERMRQLIEEPRADTDEARLRDLRWRLTRRLLDDPIVYFEDLDADELDYLNKQRGRLLRRVEEATGMIPEVRAEGIAMLDDRGDSTDLEMPADGTDGHFTLLLAEYLAQRLRNTAAIQIGMGELQEYAAALIRQHAVHWRKAVREPGAETCLVDDALRRLAGLRLIRREGDFVLPRAAIARYGVGLESDEASSNEDTDHSLGQGLLWGAE